MTLSQFSRRFYVLYNSIVIMTDTCMHMINSGEVK
uniref:Uncharacterized protein n=1 Tax=Anguilla anguilla TaxID=7936 RepID=A0A0E9RZN3_ANGAN